MAEIDILNIFLNDHEIGAIARLPGDRHLFTFNQNYIDDVHRPTLSLSFKDIYGGLLTSVRPTQTRLPPFFSNLLPEGKMRDYLAAQAGVKSEREFYLLWILGRDLPGAIKALPIKGQNLPVQTRSGLVESEDKSDQKNIFHFSLAGLQFKFSAIKKHHRGFTIPTTGIGGSWILKLPDPRYENVPENEYAMMELARSIGINVPQTMLIPMKAISGLPEKFIKKDSHVYAIKRFDRHEDGSLIHIEDFAQIFNVYADKKYGHASYRNVAEVIWAEIGEPGIVEFIRRLVFNILIGNGDMHLKNWSLIYPDGRTPALAPAYDFVSTIPYIKDDALALNIINTKEFSDITVDLFSRFAAKAKLPEKLVLDTVTETVELFAQQWQHASDFAIDQHVKKTIDKHLKTLPLWTAQS